MAIAQPKHVTYCKSALLEVMEHAMNLLLHPSGTIIKFALLLFLCIKCNFVDGVIN